MRLEGEDGPSARLPIPGGSFGTARSVHS